MILLEAAKDMDRPITASGLFSTFVFFSKVRLSFVFGKAVAALTAGNAGKGGVGSFWAVLVSLGFVAGFLGSLGTTFSFSCNSVAVVVGGIDSSFSFLLKSCFGATAALLICPV